MLGLAVEVYMLAFRTTTHVEVKSERPVLVKEFGAQVSVTQTFPIRSDGFKGVRLRLAVSEPLDITFDWMLSEQQPTELVPLYGNRQRVQNAAGERWVAILFPAIARSTGRTYRLEVHAIDVQPHDRGLSRVPASDSTALVASVDDALAGGVLAVGGQERSGDLVFDTVALGDTILGRFMLSASEGEGPHYLAWLAGAAIVLHNILLAAFVIHVWSRTRPVPDQPAPPVFEP